MPASSEKRLDIKATSKYTTTKNPIATSRPRAQLVLARFATATPELGGGGIVGFSRCQWGRSSFEVTFGVIQTEGDLKIESHRDKVKFSI